MAQGYDCEMYNKALTQFDSRWDSTPSPFNNKKKLYYFIRKAKFNLKKIYIESRQFEFFQNNPLRWEDLESFSLETDSVNCNFCGFLNYEYHYEKDAPKLPKWTFGNIK